MKSLRRVSAVLSGVLLYSTAVLVSGILAELEWPRFFYAALGGRTSLAVLVVESLLIALPVFGLALAWSYVTVRPPKLGRRPTTAWCLGGLGLAGFGWLVFGVYDMAQTPDAFNQTLGKLLLSSSTPPLWGLLNVLAVLLGTVLAGTLARQRYSQLHVKAGKP